MKPSPELSTVSLVGTFLLSGCLNLNSQELCSNPDADPTNCYGARPGTPDGGVTTSEAGGATGGASGTGGAGGGGDDASTTPSQSMDSGNGLNGRVDAGVIKDGLEQPKDAEPVDASTEVREVNAPSVVCGDGVTAAPEMCDDGMANGTALGACNPICTGRVQERRFRLTKQMFDGNLGGVVGADAKCAAEFGPAYKALIEDGVLRIATTSRGNATTGTGIKRTNPVDWVLQPFTVYVNKASQRVWMTDESALLGVKAGKSFPLLESRIDPDAPIEQFASIWAGIDFDGSPTLNNCSGWTSNSDRPAFGGILSNDGSLQIWPDGGGSYSDPCLVLNPLACVEQ